MLRLAEGTFEEALRFDPDPRAGYLFDEDLTFEPTNEETVEIEIEYAGGELRYFDPAFDLTPSLRCRGRLDIEVRVRLRTPSGAFEGGANTAGAQDTENTGVSAGAGGGDAASASAPTLIDETGPDNPAGLTSGEVAELVAGGPTANLRWLYPYDGTVFPGGTVAPLVMWTPSNYCINGFCSVVEVL